MVVFYLEPSALVKRYKVEPGSGVIDELFKGKTNSEVFITSHLTVLELNSVAARLVRAREISQRRYRQFMGTFSAEIDSHGIVVLPLQPNLINQALNVVQRYPLRSGDALHLATLLHVGGSLAGEQVYMVTSDRDLEAGCKAHDFPALNPEAASAAETLSAIR